MTTYFLIACSPLIIYGHDKETTDQSLFGQWMRVPCMVWISVVQTRGLHYAAIFSLLRFNSRGGVIKESHGWQKLVLNGTTMATKMSVRQLCVT